MKNQITQFINLTLLIMSILIIFAVSGCQTKLNVEESENNPPLIPPNNEELDKFKLKHQPKLGEIYSVNMGYYFFATDYSIIKIVGTDGSELIGCLYDNKFKERPTIDGINNLKDCGGKDYSKVNMHSKYGCLPEYIRLGKDNLREIRPKFIRKSELTEGEKLRFIKNKEYSKELVCL